jgi:hypothetical protein
MDIPPLRTKNGQEIPVNPSPKILASLQSSAASGNFQMKLLSCFFFVGTACFKIVLRAVISILGLSDNAADWQRMMVQTSS